MRIIIKGRKGLKVDANLRAYIEERIKKYEKIVQEPAICEVMLSDTRGPKGGNDKVVHITLTLPHLKQSLFVRERTADFKGSIDLAQEKLEQQILKYKEKIKNVA